MCYNVVMEHLSNIIGIPAHINEILDHNLVNLHRHPSRLELLYMANGDCTLYYEKAETHEIQEYLLLSGQFVIIHPNIQHGWSSGPVHYIVLELETKDQNADLMRIIAGSDIVSNFHDKKSFIENFQDVLILNDNHNVLSSLTSFLNIINQPKFEQNDMLANIGFSCYARTLLYEILECQRSSLTQGRGNIHIKKAFLYFEANYRNQITLQSLASHLHLSPMHTERIFRSAYGMTAMKKFNEFRIEKAKILLSHTTYPIPKISKLVGYANDQSFLNNFKNYVGQSPIQFRNNSMTQNVQDYLRITPYIQFLDDSHVTI